jgi:hypothetical protein
MNMKSMMLCVVTVCNSEKSLCFGENIASAFRVKDERKQETTFHLLENLSSKEIWVRVCGS